MSSAERSNERLAARRRSRRRSRRRAFIAPCVLVLMLLGALVWGLRQSSVRVAHVDVYGTDASFAAYAREAMSGSYFGIIPRDSAFLFPAPRIRAAILADHPGIAAVSISRNGFTGISIKPDERAPVARWCPSTSSGQAAEVEGQCYVFDAGGFIFAAAATSTRTINTFVLYAPLAGETLEPLRATIAQAEKLPAAFDFARQLDTFGSPASHLVLRGDEVDTYLASGTRITYVLGHEQDAFTALVSSRENMNLANGSIEYVDLRFDGKVYLKKK